MGSLVNKLYPDTQVTDFCPEHSKGLSNEFRCYASYNSSRWNLM
jgi:hypothetical protein